MRFSLALEVFLLTIHLFYLRRGNYKQTRPNLTSTRVELQEKKTKPIFHRRQKDQAEFQPQAKKIKPIYRKQPRPTISRKHLAVSKQDLPFDFQVG